MSLTDRLKKLIKEAVIPLDYPSTKQDLTLQILLHNLATYRDIEHGFRSLAELRSVLMLAIANEYVTKNKEGKYVLTQKGVSKFRQLTYGEKR